MKPFLMKVMNTTVYIEVSNCSIPQWHSIMDQWFHMIETEWSRFRDGNALATLNDAEQGSILTVSSDLYELLKVAEQYRIYSNGRFSPYLKKAMERNGYDRSFPFYNAERYEDKPTRMKVAPIPIQFLDHNQILKSTESEIDLGGIAKGYAADKAANWLKTIGQASYGIVDIGGDMVVWSDGRKVWKIGIEDPYDEKRELGQIQLKNGAIATSNVVYRSWKQGDERKHHLLDGQTGLPVQSSLVQATAVTKNAVEAEVATKLCFLLQKQERDDWFKTYIPTCSRCLVKKNRTIIYEKGGE